MNCLRCSSRPSFTTSNTRERRITSTCNRGSLAMDCGVKPCSTAPSRSDVALIYNDRAVLENHHVSAAFRLMRIEDYNILAEFTVDEYKWAETIQSAMELLSVGRNFRQLVIEMVLATDMSSHFTQLKTMKSLLSMPEKCVWSSMTRSGDTRGHSSIEKSKALALVLHCADISHPGKPWPIHFTWTESLMEEYFKQGEKEKELGLPCSPLCDRDNTLVAESQIGRSTRSMTTMKAVSRLYSIHCRTFVCRHGWYVRKDSSLSIRPRLRTSLAFDDHEECSILSVPGDIAEIVQRFQSTSPPRTAGESVRRSSTMATNVFSVGIDRRENHRPWPRLFFDRLRFDGPG